MRNYILKLSIFFSLSFFFNCQKMDNCTENPNDFKTAPYSVEALIKNSKDIQDEKINSILLQVSKAMREVVKDDEIRYFLLKEAKDKENHMLNLPDLLLKNLSLKNKLESQFHSNQKTEEGDVDFDNLVTQMVYDSVQYYPAIYIPNVGSSDNNLFPVISIGTDLADLNYSEDYNDYIPGWIIESDSTFSDIILNEVDAMNAIRPVMIFVNHTDFSLVLDTPTITDTTVINEGGKTETTGDPYAFSYRLLQSYEASGASEYRYKYIQLLEGAKPTDVQGPWSHAIDNIPHSEIGNLITNKHCDILAGPLALDGIWFTTFEYDWYSSDKDLCFYNFYPGGIFACPNGRRKYTNEWYQYQYIRFSSSFQVPTVLDMGKGDLTIKWN